MAVVRGIERFEGRSTFKTWLFRICVNRARSAGVREHRSVPVDLTPAGPTVDTSRFNGAGMWADPPVPFTELVEGRIDDKPTVAAIRRTIDGLPETTRAVVTLRDVEGLSTVEVADLLGITEANVRVHRAPRQSQGASGAGGHDEGRAAMRLLTADIECRQAVELVSDYLDGALSRRDRRRLERHLAKCDACSAYLEQIRTTIEVTGKIEPDDLDPEVLDGLVDLFRQYRPNEE